MKVYVWAGANVDYPHVSEHSFVVIITDFTKSIHRMKIGKTYYYVTDPVSEEEFWKS